MEIQEKPYIYKDNEYGKQYYYTNIEPEEIPREHGVRVLPAQYYYEKRLVFTLVKRYEPGEHSLFPNGGYDLRDEGGGIRSYELNQVVIHPNVFTYKKHLEKVAKKYAKEEEKLEKRKTKTLKLLDNGKKRGRPSLTAEEKILKETLAANRLKTGRKGRPALSPEEKALREAEKEKRRALSGGKRGRPKKN